MNIGEYDRYLEIIQVTKTKDVATGQALENETVTGNCFANVDEIAASESEVSGVVLTQVAGEIRIHGLLPVKATDYLADPLTEERWEIQGVRADRRANETIATVTKYQASP